MTQTSQVLYHFLAFREAERQKRIDLYGGNRWKMWCGSVLFCSRRCAIGLSEQLNCGMRTCNKPRDVKPLQDHRSKKFRLMTQFWSFNTYISTPTLFFSHVLGKHLRLRNNTFYLILKSYKETLKLGCAARFITVLIWDGAGRLHSTHTTVKSA